VVSWIGFAQESEKPVCNAKTRGQFWPAEANESRSELSKYIQQGDLEICTFGTYRYKWVRASVNVRDLVRVKSASSQR